MDFILQNKWFILLTLEVLAWLATFFMMYARYRLGSTALFRAGAILTVLTGVIPQVVLGIINLIVEHTFDLFTFIIILFIIYGLTLGRKQIKKLDVWAQRKLSKKNAV
ncbi:hypothetical protein Back11_28450 [Paenibacillus baekrokdamisoli]|uniref:Uncharacterized protein n=1 Tax=Paenibacillus baekrokdamisoli TaxID=1712516 RepID=A0A3G9IRK9_9BACL|nr:hypothetical protein [Paenibacillus baekrokdamisoli]MBB3071083.1 hypothetical protein [Paenibacillus baekrokdamisoli]BBH21500.1 hypothetical protein Back11_28450 [Paenibacillus baekrokdamisoli]